MKQTEKLDLILRTLYQFRHDGNDHSIESIYKEQNIPVESHDEVRMLANRLKDDGYVKATFIFSGIFIILTSHGIEYCEEDSYSYKGNPITSNTYSLTISNSPNANIISNSTNSTIQIHNHSEIKSKIVEIREAIHNNKDISSEQKENLIDCLEEVETSIDAGKKAKFSFKHLTEQGSDIAGISSLLIDLGQMIFGG